MIYFGYEYNGRSNEYIYRSTQSETEKKRRESGIGEVRRFCQELSRIKSGNLEDLEDFLVSKYSVRFFVKFISRI